MSSSSSSPSPNNYFFHYRKLHFFSHIRRLLRLRSSNKVYPPLDQEGGDQIPIKKKEGGDQRMEKEDGLVVLQMSVKRLHFGDLEEKEVAAEEIWKLAKEDMKTRKLLAELGVVPPLVAMVGSEVGRRRWLAVRALVELSNRTFTNKSTILEAGLLSKLPTNVDDLDEPTIREIAQLLLSLSSLANHQFPITYTPILPFMSHILESNSTSGETKDICLGTLQNLSTNLDNAGAIAKNGIVKTLLNLSISKQTSDKSLATLANLVVTQMGKKSMEDHPMVPNSLIEILTWEDKPKSQELSAYILMILSHQSSEQREKMASLGIVDVLVELALLGSPLAQKRAAKLLQWFREERNARMRPHSGPQTTRRVSVGSLMNERETEKGKKVMKRMVTQSLHKNMETIARRANFDMDATSKLKNLVISSSSKSLPY